MSQKSVTFSTSLISIADNEFKIKSLYNNDLILNIALKSKETVQKLQFLDSPVPRYINKGDSKVFGILFRKEIIIILSVSCSIFDIAN